MHDNQILAYPLHWPAGQPRTKVRGYNTRMARPTVASACADIANEVRMLQGRDLVISTNLALRIDGLPRSGQPAPSDPGAAVYFRRPRLVTGSQRLAFACDKYRVIEQNLRSIAMHLNALRGMERWGVGTRDQAFAGYTALPLRSDRTWWQVLGAVTSINTVEDLVAHYRDAAKRTHPDAGGSDTAFYEVRKAYEEGAAALGAHA